MLYTLHDPGWRLGIPMLLDLDLDLVKRVLTRCDPVSCDGRWD